MGGATRYNATMNPHLRRHFELELRAFREAEAREEMTAAWRLLERAHILSQAHAWPHLRVHGAMFAFAWRRRDMREWLGQWPRLLLAAPGSWLGRAPRGNTGGAHVGLFTPMPIPEDLQEWLREAEANPSRPPR
ncbi:DUF3703 domain-containing protein [Stigmatella sp. ncwal1]|uniref:DUF3703 domain-containing protein n=1 Tax=Stigmatella ashevillensis TaxID=2995309 RepID=A0ABT5D1U2_9BACT|nr:DUF3703 domain-containing protein [Stigmatella ashevillena]MDC0707625.1 DUF3703 domain-containing protein [Stigmatella ashevillena]